MDKAVKTLKEETKPTERQPKKWKMDVEYKVDYRNENEKAGFLFDEPECLVYTDDQNKLAINQPILDKIAQVSKQLNVVTIAGLYRTGKSYLLTRLAGRYKGFPLGSTIQSKTKGIWAWCLDHPMKVNQKLLLLDTEGLGDIKKGDANNDNQLFSLVTLLSSTLVYNTMGAFDQDALNKLHFITEMSKYILASNDPESKRTDNGFDLYFPEFILTLRDFTLELKIDDVEITSDEYLEDCLTLMQGSDMVTKEYNKPRTCMRKYFKKRKCFVFEQPAKRKKLHCLEELKDGQLDEDFVRSVMEFKDYVHHSCRPFTLLDGTPVSGRMFSHLASTYVSAIRDGAIPCIQTALHSMAKQENEKAVQNAIQCYVNGMDKDLTLPTDDENIVLLTHLKYKESAFKVFLGDSILDKENVYKAEMDKKVEDEYTQIYLRNGVLSTEKCRDAIQRHRVDLEVKIANGSYSIAGGSTIYKRDREALKAIYFNLENLGVNRDKTYVAFCKEWETEQNGIYKSDMALTEKERLAEVERLNNEKIRQEEEMYRRESKLMKIQLEKNCKQLEKEMNQVNERHERDMTVQQERYDEMNTKRQDDMDRLRKEQQAALQEINTKYEKQNQNMQSKLNERDAQINEANRRYEGYIEKLNDERRDSDKRLESMRQEYTAAQQNLQRSLVNAQRPRGGGCSIL